MFELERAPRLFYHYTSTNGLKGILDKKDEKIKLWFTHYKYLNDKSEGEILQSVYIEACNQLLDEGKISQAEHDDMARLVIKDSGVYAYTTADGLTHIKQRDTTMFVCCFCLKDDLLGMWRYYSKDDMGYSLGFKGELMARSKQSDPFKPDNNKLGKFEWSKIIYKHDEQLQLVKDALESQIDRCRESNIQISQSNLSMFDSELARQRLFFKHECFEEEQEYRAVLSIPNEKCVGKETYAIEYRTSNGMRIPYIVVPFDKKFLYSVKLGPTAPIEAEESLKRYVDEFKNGVKISHSELPIRY